MYFQSESVNFLKVNKERSVRKQVVLNVHQWMQYNGNEYDWKETSSNTGGRGCHSVLIDSFRPSAFINQLTQSWHSPPLPSVWLSFFPIIIHYLIVLLFGKFDNFWLLWHQGSVIDTRGRLMKESKLDVPILFKANFIFFLSFFHFWVSPKACLKC